MSRAPSLTEETARSGVAPLVRIDRVTKHFTLPRKGFAKPQHVHSLDDVSLQIEQGQVVGLVGESGSGKSTLARVLLRLVPSDTGEIEIDGIPVHRLKRLREMRVLRRTAQLVFQDPHASMDPKMSIRESLTAVLTQNQIGNKQDRDQRILSALTSVELDETYLDRYPQECSGGQLQRVVVARALLLDPKLLVCDEPTSALDASVQAKVLNLLRDIHRRSQLTMLVISHDLRVVRLISDRVAVMYLGEIVEVAETEEIFDNALHPYTFALLEAGKEREPGTVAPVLAAGEPPSALAPPSGCRFRTRCPLAVEQCTTEAPQLRPVSSGHEVRCHRAEESRALVAQIIAEQAAAHAAGLLAVPTVDSVPTDERSAVE